MRKNILRQGGGVFISKSRELAGGIRWHPGFYGAMELELAGNQGELEFLREYPLGREPLRMDLLVIKKRETAEIGNEIGRIFRTYNVIEYKSPEDGLTIDDFVKTAGYACLYKGLGTTADQIPLRELSLSLFREAYPRELMDSLRREGFLVEEAFPGIYYVGGEWPFATQIVVTGRLDPSAHRSLRILSKKDTEEDVRRFLEEALERTEPGERSNVDAVLQISVSANRELYETVRRDSVMCQALRELMKDEIAAERRDTLLKAIENLMDSMKLSSKQAMDALKIPLEEQRKMISYL